MLDFEFRLSGIPALHATNEVTLVVANYFNSITTNKAFAFNKGS